MNTVFVKGDVVMVYVGAVRQENPEGLARLVTYVEGENLRGLEMWRVEFKDAPGKIYKRFINRSTRPTRAVLVSFGSAQVEV